MTGILQCKPEERVLSYLDELISTRVLNYTRTLGKESEIGPAMRRCNAFYGKVIYDIANGQTPTLKQFTGMGFKEEDEAVFQAGVFHYEKWKRLGVLSSVFAYCQKMNHLFDLLLERNGIPKTETAPDFRNDVINITGTIKSICAGK